MSETTEFQFREGTVSYAYEIYKKEVGGITWEGKPMKEFDELPNNIKNAWCMIDKVLSNGNDGKRYQY